jgi:hypothetical protein
MNQFGDGVGIVDEKVVILEYKQHHAGRNDTQDEPYLFRSAFRRSDFDTSEIINENGDEQNENVLRNEEHVKYAAADE